jgi:hypothetical protein
VKFLSKKAGSFGSFVSESSGTNKIRWSRDCVGDISNIWKQCQL